MDIKQEFPLSTEELYWGQGWVSHHRPARNPYRSNSFKYSTFNLLIPIHDKTEAHLRQSFDTIFFSVQTKDYLGGNTQSLSQGIRHFLKTDLQYEADHIWLQTLPRMMGYAFNPVSFWYLFKKGQLDAVLCEVNNTFRDRHFYFVNQLSGAVPAKICLPKSFHVSPFFPVDGYYQFSFQLTDKKSDVRIQFFSAEQLLLDTSICLKLSPFKDRSYWYLLKKYGWLTFMVIFRIHFQAIKLFFKKARFHKRPHPPKKSLTQ